jgi:RimJ/RimL family protein N-acetyltransferase
MQGLLFMKIFETERLEFTLYDESLYADFVSLFTNGEVMKYVDTGMLSQEAADALWHRLVKEFYPTGVKTIWAVVAKTDGRFIGNASIRPRPTHKNETEIGYMLMPVEWGKGYATEIARALVRFGFDELKLGTVYATVDIENTDSIHVLEKCGMTQMRIEYDEFGPFYVYNVSK